MKLASKELDEYLDKVPASILSQTLGRIVTSEEPTPAEQTKINEAGYKCHRKAVTATTLIYNSLLSTVQNKVHNDKVDTKDPNQKALSSGCNRSSAQRRSPASPNYGLWSGGMKVDEGEDPNPVLASVRSSLGELRSSLPAEMTAAQLVESMSAFAMLQTLPESYSLLAFTLFASARLLRRLMHFSPLPILCTRLNPHPGCPSQFPERTPNGFRDDFRVHRATGRPGNRHTVSKT
jgi:hypothetical protein